MSPWEIRDELDAVLCRAVDSGFCAVVLPVSEGGEDKPSIVTYVHVIRIDCWDKVVQAICSRCHGQLNVVANGMRRLPTDG